MLQGIGPFIQYLRQKLVDPPVQTVKKQRGGGITWDFTLPGMSRKFYEEVVVVELHQQLPEHDTMVVECDGVLTLSIVLPKASFQKLLAVPLHQLLADLPEDSIKALRTLDAKYVAKAWKAGTP